MLITGIITYNVLSDLNLVIPRTGYKPTHRAHIDMFNIHRALMFDFFAKQLIKQCSASCDEGTYIYNLIKEDDSVTQSQKLLIQKACRHYLLIHGYYYLYSKAKIESLFYKIRFQFK